MRLPEETKKWLKYCSEVNPCEKCSYDRRDYPHCIIRLMKDAVGSIDVLEEGNAQRDRNIRQLEDHLRDATKKVEQLEAERDAAVDDLRYAVSHPHTAGACYACKHHDDCKFQEDCDIMDNDYWEWRGVQKEE